jgi:hypothetical protein
MKNIWSGSVPLLRTAVLCDRVLTERDGTLSVIRIIDRLAVNVAREQASHPEMAVVRAHLVLLLTLAGAEERAGRHRLLMKTQLPSGTFVGANQMECEIPREPEASVSLVIDLTFEARESGTYWFWFALDSDDAVLTRLPLLVERRIVD